MTKCSQVSEPDVGNNLRETDRNMINISANQKLGSACPITDRKRAIRSIKLFGLIAAATPSGTDSKIANVMAQTPKVIVVGKRSPIRALTSVLK